MLNSKTEETRIVGGSVRDALLGSDNSDIDLATTLLPNEVMRRAATTSLKAIPTGIDHGTVTILLGRRTFEVTTLREDIETDGRHAVVRFGRSFARDAERRDFTINALSLDEDGKVHDTVGGMADLSAGRVRFIGDAATRIREDALRILRFFRFHARYGIGEPDKDGVRSAISAAATLDGLSRERVRSEALKLLEAPRAVAVIAAMRDAGLLDRIIQTGGYLDRLDRACRADGLASPTAPIERLAALAVDSRADIERLRRTLRLSNEETYVLETYADARQDLEHLAEVATVDMRRLAATRNLHGVALAIDVMDDLRKRRISREALTVLDHFLDGTDPIPVLPVSGRDLVAMDIPPGRSIGAGLAAAHSLWLQRGCASGEKEKAFLLQYILAAIGPKA
ncbi:CCA tRNA nucleotidyltransferase [Methylobacterium marchantiae]|uniref:CCA tRNA nucleotidyltransferase n=1 Tax=Methylobacterium marchantiae TaxID=600331 RepID=A0ABW3X4F1_9HYPH